MKHAFSGQCAPGTTASPFAYSTFSLGVYELVPKAKGNGTKRGATKVRIVGLTCNPAPVREMAERVVAELDAGTYSGPKRIVIGNAR